jgi:hypothetical protein
MAPMTKGDKNGRKHHKAGAARTVGPVRSSFDTCFARYDIRAGMLGHEGTRLDEGMYGGIFRTIRVHPVHLKGKGKI